jgi:hypothetical protein
MLRRSEGRLVREGSRRILGIELQGKCNCEGQDWSKKPQEQNEHLTYASRRLTIEMSGAHAAN